jgi:hypothetical protein
MVLEVWAQIDHHTRDIAGFIQSETLDHWNDSDVHNMDVNSPCHADQVGGWRAGEPKGRQSSPPGPGGPAAILSPEAYLGL